MPTNPTSLGKPSTKQTKTVKFSHLHQPLSEDVEPGLSGQSLNIHEGDGVVKHVTPLHTHAQPSFKVNKLTTTPP